jgi:hypothetical protein
MPIYGRQAAIGLCFQNSFDTIASITDSVQTIPIVSDNITPKRPVINQQNMRGIFEEGESYLGPCEVSGEIEMETHPVAMGYMLGAFFGTASVATSDSIYTHEWTPKDSPFDGVRGYSFKRPLTYVSRNRFGGLDTNFFNLVANTLSINIANGELLKFTTGFVGGRDNEGSTTFSEDFPDGNEVFTWDASSVTIGTMGAVSEIKELSISLEDPIEPKYYLDDIVWPRKNVLTGRRKATISGSLLYDTNSFYQAFADKTEHDFDITFQDATEIQSGYYNKFNMLFERVRIETAEANRGGPGEVLLSFTGNAHYDDSASTMVKFTLTNTKSAY